MAEENFHGYFWTDKLDADGKPDLSAQPEAAQMKRYGVPGMWYAWGQQHDRFNIDAEPNMPNKFGWVVEVDPKDLRQRQSSTLPWAVSAMKGPKPQCLRAAN